MELNEDDKKTIGNIIILMITITIIFLFILSILNIKIKNQTVCDIDEYSELQGRPLTLSTQVLTNDDAVLQKFVFEDLHNDLDFKFCYWTDVKGDHIVYVVDGNNTRIGKSYVSNETEFVCTSIITKDLRHEIYMGLECSTCSPVNKITILKEVGGKNVEQVKTDFVTASITIDNTLAFKIIGTHDCKQAVHQFSKYYYSLIGVCALLILILVGYSKFRDEILDNS